MPLGAKITSKKVLWNWHQVEVEEGIVENCDALKWRCRICDATQLTSTAIKEIQNVQT